MSLAVRRSKTTKLIVKLIMVYLICVIPVCVYNIVFLLIQDELESEKLKDIQCLGVYLYAIYWLQYTVNHIIYVKSSDKFKSALTQLLYLIFYCKFKRPSILTNQFKENERSLHHRRNTEPEICYTISQEIPNPQRIKTPSESTIDLEGETNVKDIRNMTYGFKAKTSIGSTINLMSDMCQLKKFRKYNM